MANPWQELAHEFGARYRVPPGLILALIDLESGGDPNNVNPTSNATGLMQVTPIALKDWNERHGKTLLMRDMVHPRDNIAIGAELLARIANTYHEKNGLAIDWKSRPFVDLVVFGWNAGYSQKAGVGRVLQTLKEKGLPLTAAQVWRTAQTMGDVSQHVKNKNRLLWSRRVTDRMLGKRPEPAPQKGRGTNWGKVAFWTGAVGLVGGLTWYTVSKSRRKRERAALAAAEAQQPAPAPAPAPYIPPVVVVKGA